MSEITIIPFRIKLSAGPRDTTTGYKIPEYEIWKDAHKNAKVHSIDAYLRGDKGVLFVQWSVPQ